jgi:molybdenum cofactor cytidylyltransferase
MIGAIVLAAGRSERMGTQKLLLPLGGKPVIACVVDELLRSPVEVTLVVIGRDGAGVREGLASRPVQFVENPDPTSDMLASVRCGLRALPTGCSGRLVVVGDQPGLDHAVVEAMIAVFRCDESRIIVPASQGRRGHPLLFGIAVGEEVLRCFEGEGLRGLLAAHPEAVVELPVQDAATLEDMDTPADYARQQELLATRVRPAPLRPGDQSG